MARRATGDALRTRRCRTVEPIRRLGAAFVAASPASVRAWYEQLLGGAPDFFPRETEAVCGLDAHRRIYIVQRPERAKSALVTVMFDDLDVHADRVARIGGRGIDPPSEGAYEGGARKVVHHDPDGNEIGFGGAPAV